MSESTGASVIPFKVGEEAGDDTSAAVNPAERLHLAEAVRMAEAIVFASAEPVSEKQLAARLPEASTLPPPWPTCAGSTSGAASTWSGSATRGRFARPATSPF